MELWQVWTAISAVPTAWRSYVTHYPFEEHHSNTLWYNCICPLSRLAIFIWTLVGCSILSDKDERSIVITCSTFVNPESSITATHSPLMNVSPRIRSYFDILSNKIKKGTRPSGQVPLLNMSELTYSSTAAWRSAITSLLIIFPFCSMTTAAPPALSLWP